MSAQASIYGRLGTDPDRRTAASGKDWCRASLAVQLAKPRDGEDQPPATWFTIVAFGKLADTLARHAKGDLLSVSGELTLNRWAGKDGSQREGWQLVADSIVSARAVRPAGGHG